MRGDPIDLSSVTLRPYTVDDAERAFEIFSAHAELSGRKHYLGFRSALLEPDSFMLAAIQAGELIGVGALQYDEDGRIAMLHTDGVAPGQRNRGIGTALVMARLAAIGEDIGCESVGLLATEFSRGFYARFGFVMVGEPEFDASQGFELVGMELAFSDDLRNSAKRWLSDARIRIEEQA